MFLYTLLSLSSSCIIRGVVGEIASDGVLGVLGGVLGGSRVISKQLPSLMCVHRESRIPAIMPTMALEHAAMMSVKSVAEYCMDGGGVAIDCMYDERF